MWLMNDHEYLNEGVGLVHVIAGYSSVKERAKKPNSPKGSS